jgi:hypothetical protein
MRKLPKILKQIIKKERFSLDTTNTENSWRGGLKINYRITMVKRDSEDWDENSTPIDCNNSYSNILVNIKVSGKIETRTNRHDSNTKSLVDIRDVAGKYKRGGGDGWHHYYNDNYDGMWGYHAHKRVRQEIRSEVKNEIKDYLKLMGISSSTWDPVQIKTITWEK